MAEAVLLAVCRMPRMLSFSEDLLTQVQTKQVLSELRVQDSLLSLFSATQLTTVLVFIEAQSMITTSLEHVNRFTRRRLQA